ncbi:hypothetical protein BASA81_007288 [Batrachochytrium salamandrivorans]|nr:hypothetical protein BASA81_007288 [Batrachochytrium salamandrivorans]
MHRVRDKAKLASATWEQEEGHAVVQKVKGKYFQNLGFSHHGQRLFCEEAVFLVDRDEMELLRESGVEFTKAEAFALLGECGISLLAYQAYACLQEQRFHVYRHGAWKTERHEWKNLPKPRVGSGGVGLSSAAAGEEGVAPNKRQRLDCPVAISYDVYMPQANFSKTNLAKPHFSLIILSTLEPLPAIPVLKSCLTTSDTVLRLCIVGDSSMSFIEVSDFDPVAAHAATVLVSNEQEEEEDDDDEDED